MDVPSRSRTRSTAPWATLLWLLTFLFSLRVLGQAAQRWSPQPWLPPFGAWQGSSLGYPLLLAAQVVILATMTWVSYGAWTGALEPSERAMKWLAILGTIYMLLALGRISIGLGIASAPHWFRAWLSGAFHIVLAGFVLASARYHAVALRTQQNARAGSILSYVWYPAIMACATAAFAWLLARGAAPAVAAYLPAIAAGTVIVLLELRFPARADWRPTRSDVAADAAFMTLVMVALPRLLAGLVVLALADARHAAGASALWPHDWPLAAQVIAMVLAVDFMRYWLHRACHAFTPLWRLHEVHHSPDILYVVNVARFHPLEKALHFTLDTVPFLVLGIAPEVLAGYFLLYSVNGFFQHSNLELRYGWLNYVVGSAETHRWHHARDPRQVACNFGNTTLVWDLAFGTWRLPGAVGDIGIPDRAYPKGFLAQMAAPFRRRDGNPRRTPRRWLTDALVGALLKVSQALAMRRLRSAMRNPMLVQRELLARIVRENRETRFGIKHHFASVTGYESFAHRVPVADFERLRPYVQAQIDGGERALTTEAPARYVRTSGTTDVPKDVPLTPSHLTALRRIHRDSVAMQYRNCPEAFAGGIIAMVSPAFEGRLVNGAPYGSSSGIVAGDTPALVREKFVVPGSVLAIEESHVKYLLALRLAIARADVTYVGAANPTTLLTLSRLFREHRAQLCADLRRGTFFLASRVPSAVMREISPRLRADAARAAALERLPEHTSLGDLWPALRLVVTWTCASAGIAVQVVRSELPPGVRVMELGYLSSEFRGTVTLGRHPGSGFPTLDTHFFELVERERWDAGTPEFLTLDQVRKGGEYYVIVTTPSGLYRYFINDVVEVTGFLHATPLLRFVQKGKGVTNITGEKLCEAQVLQAVREAMRAMGYAARFVMMVADEDARHYRLYVELGENCGVEASTLAREVDARLARLNVEYKAKRESERLAPLQARWLAAGTGDAYKRHCVVNGQREGQFKMVALEYRRRFSFDLEAHTEG